MSVAVDWSAGPARTEILGCAVSIARAVKVLTLRVVVQACPPKDALIVVLPTARPVVRPGLDCPAVSTVALLVLDEDQFAELVRSPVELSLYVAVALNCCVAPGATVGFAGLIAIDVSVGRETFGVAPPPPQPHKLPSRTQRIPNGTFIRPPTIVPKTPLPSLALLLRKSIVGELSHRRCIQKVSSSRCGADASSSEVTTTLQHTVSPSPRNWLPSQ